RSYLRSLGCSSRYFRQELRSGATSFPTNLSSIAPESLDLLHTPSHSSRLESLINNVRGGSVQQDNHHKSKDHKCCIENGERITGDQHGRTIPSNHKTPIPDQFEEAEKDGGREKYREQHQKYASHVKNVND